jgi:hypothetical protein
MPKRRTPTKILTFTGSFAKNPARARARLNEPPPNGTLGAPPSDLSEEAVAMWNQIAAEAPPGVLCRAHRKIVWATALIGARIHEGEVTPQAVAQFRLCLTELGMTPSAASKVSASNANQETKTTNLAAI